MALVLNVLTLDVDVVVFVEDIVVEFVLWFWRCCDYGHGCGGNCVSSFNYGFGCGCGCFLGLRHLEVILGESLCA